MDGYGPCGWTWTLAVLLLIFICRLISFRRRRRPRPHKSSSFPASKASLSAPGIISDSDLKNLMEDLDENNSSSTSASNINIWENVVDRSCNSISYVAKCCKSKDGVGPLKYLSVTTFEDCSVDLLLDFYMDYDYRMQWDKTFVHHQQLQLDHASSTEFGLTIKKFTFLTPREYVLAWKLWQGTDGSFYCFSKECEHPLAPRNRKNVRVAVFRSGWRIRKVPGRNACEIRMVHQEDAGLNVEMAKLAFAKGIWSYVYKMDDALRKYSVKKQHQLSSIAGARLCIQKVPAEFEVRDDSISRVDEAVPGDNQRLGNCRSNKTKLRRMPSSKVIANGLVLLGGAICLSRGHSSLGSKVAMAYLLSKLTKRASLDLSWKEIDQSATEAQSLMKFKSSLVNADPALSNWNPATPPCTGERSNWAGVLCYNGYVWGLQLERMNLGGQIDVDALQPLRYMRAVSFMGNSFVVPMPDWKKVGAIKALYLSDNQFSGQIPADAFKGMYSLKKVHLANNRFTGPLPTSLESPKLIELRLDGNQFTGAIPKISSENLKLLNVSNNRLEGPIPSALSAMDPASFTGNTALCGEPLTTLCDPILYPPAAPIAQSQSQLPIALLVACIVVGLILIILLIILLRWRRRGSQTPQLGKPIDVEKNSNNINLNAVAVAVPAAASTSASAAGGHNIETNNNNHQVIGTPGRRSDQHQPGKLSFVDEKRQKFDLQDLMRASAEVLGSGNFGASYKAVLVDGEALVVKRFKQMNGIAREDFHEHMRRLGRLKHPNLLPLVAYLYRKEEKLLVSDFVTNGSLATLLHGKHSGVLKWSSRLKIIKGVAKGLIYLQNEVPTLSVPHGHLKSSNVLLDEDYNPLLMDYALLPVVNASHVHHVLLAYKSPEYAQHGRITKKTDVWCLGTLILETLTGRYLAHGTSADLAAWINGIAGEEESRVFDRQMEGGASASSRNQMEKMLQIGISCCKEDADKRWDLDEAARQIDLIQHDDD
ncbi:hypothetical protein C2S51_000037 [Perilla frutescens var. frutescens]|nr:hypothetical protein C2S51_000037 [Perilla frutescens var. frutescens]